MKAIEEGNITSHNLDRLKSLLTGHSNSGPNVVEQIPNKAHIFHGAYDDSSLTHANLQLASRILLGMTLGYVDEAPLIMIFEERSEEFRVIDLLDKNHLEKAEAFVETFQRQSEQDMGNTLKEHLTA